MTDYERIIAEQQRMLRESYQCISEARRQLIQWILFALCGWGFAVLFAVLGR